MLNILVPMAGHGSRFAAAGYTLPKPLIPVGAQSMIELVIANLRPQRAHRFIFLCQQAHLDQYGLAAVLEQAAPGCVIIGLNQVTQGAACTVLLAKSFIDNADPLMIANCDQYVDVSIDAYLDALDRDSAAAGLIMTMTADDPKWSFVRLDAAGRICEVREKEVVSHEATVGIYNFRHGSDFVRAAERMIAADKRVNGEFYVAPAYNELLAEGQSVAYFNIGSDQHGMYGLGIPADLEAFLNGPFQRLLGAAQA